MNTYAIQLELHFQSERNDDSRFDAFVGELKILASKHDISFGDYQSMQLRTADYTIKPCGSCGHLTVDQASVKYEDQNMLPDFWYYVRRGKLSADTLTCDLCRATVGAT